MKRSDRLIKKIPYVLSLLNLHYCSGDLAGELLDGNDISLFEDGNNLGRLYMLNNEIYAQVMYENQILVLKGKSISDEVTLFDIYVHKTNENKNMKLTVEYDISIDKKRQMKTTCVIFENNEFVNRAKFDSKDQFFRFTYPDEHLLHSSYKINHTKTGKNTNIENDNGVLIYEVDSIGERHKCGAIVCTEYLENYDVIDKKISEIVKEIDPEYYDLLDRQKEQLDEFVPNLFDNICFETYRKYLNSQFKDVLNIEKDDCKFVKMCKKKENI